MSAGIVLSQMLIIFTLMLIGLFLCRCGIINQDSSQILSGIVVNLCSPMQLIMSVVTNQSATVEKSSVVYFFVLSIVVYVLMILIGYILNRLLRVEQNQKADYMMMTMFGNCGFIGIPVALAIFGNASLVYVAIFNLAYNMFFYTYGLWIVTSDIEGISMKSQLKKMINPGNIACVATIILFWYDIKVPESVQALCNYTGQPATLLAMLVIGISLSNMNFKETFTDMKFNLFVLIRFFVIPAVLTIAMKFFIADPLFRGTMALMIAVPVGNMPAMIRSQFNQDNTLTAKGAVVTTILSVISITFTCLFI